MEKQPKVSVIIPVYNVEQYLSRCLDSVISQNFNDMEIICINDGSKDASLRILEEYAGKDSRIVIIDKKNAGVSAARNDGIAAAKGEYLAFLDGDDFWEADCLAKIYQEAEHNHSDIVIFAHNLWENDQKIIWDNPLLEGICGEMDLNDEAAIYAFSAVIWNKLYRRDFILANDIVFPVGIKIAEDTIFSMVCYFSKPVCRYIPEHFYNYRMNRKDSATADLGCVQGEVVAFKYLEKMPIYQCQPQTVKLKIVHKFLSGLEGHLNRFALWGNEEYMKIRDDFVAYLKKAYGSSVIEKMTHFKKLKLAEKIFSVKNYHCKKFKIIRFLGLTFKIKR